MVVDVDQQSGKGIEAAARAARYKAFASVMQLGDVLCLAHHQDDQAETLLLQLLRGAGVAGLASMPTSKVFAAGTLLRPLLQTSRCELLSYAEQHGLRWIEDPSNEHITFDRNYLRHDVMPLLKQRWPTADKSLTRSAAHLAEANTLLQEVATQDWQDMVVDSPERLSLTALDKFSVARQRNLVRHWIHRINQAPLPDSQRLQQIFTEVIAAAEDGEPCVQWHGVAVRRYRQTLYLTTDKLPSPQARDWDLTQPLMLPELNVRLVVAAAKSNALDKRLLGTKGMRIAFRLGGETCRPAGRGGQHHSLKKLMQEWGIPPWQRPRVPLLYVGNEIAAVVGYCVCEGFAAEPGLGGIGMKIEYLSGHGIAREDENNDNSQD